jgi:hypothetical protein
MGAAKKQPGTYARAGTSARGYGWEHQKIRRQWAKIIEAEGTDCHALVCVMPTREIGPGDAWHLGHTADRGGYTGPEHPKCNTRDGAKRATAARLANQRARLRAVPTTSVPSRGTDLNTSRQWIRHG